MAFDPIVACLQQITDYVRYEKLCTDLMRIDGYVGIEPLGGIADKSRDSILLRDGEEVIFHYSVRKDWKSKLWEDADGVRTHGHRFTKMVCVNPTEFTTSERDRCISDFRRDFGCTVELYGIERMASMLRSTAAILVENHPQIFTSDVIAKNRTAKVDVRVSSTRDRRRQLAQIVAYNRGPGPVLVDGWHAHWREKGLPRMHDSIECYRGHLPQRVEEKSKLDIIVPLDFEWQGLETIGIGDAEGNRHDATPQNVEFFLETARRHLPPPSPTASELTYEQVASQPVLIVLSRDRPAGSKHDRLILSFRNQGTIPLQPEHATIEWKFDTEKALAEKSHIVGPKVIESGATIGLRRIGDRRASWDGAEIQFFLDESMANMLTETISRSADIVHMEVKVRISSSLVISEIENVREVVAAVAQSVLDSWD